MRVGALLAIAFVTALLAGCASGGKSPSSSGAPASSGAAGTTGSGASGTSAAPGSAPPSSGAPGPSSNHAPVANLTAPKLAGDAPLRINFTAAGSDPDGDALSWTLAFGDGNRTTGSSLPATVSHVYAAVGNFTATLTVSDGTATANATRAIRALKAAVVAGAGQKLSGDVTMDCGNVCEPCDPVGAVGCVPVGASGCVSFAAKMSGHDCLYWPLTGADGKTLTASSTGGDPDLEFWDSCDAVMGAEVGRSWKSGPESTVVPAGTGCLIAWEWNSLLPGDTSTITVVYG